MLFFIAQSVCASIVGSPSNHLKKGSAFHWDLFVLGSLNAVLSMIGLPWIYGILPHSPLHARLLADVVPATDSQHNSTKSYVVVRVRETRVTGVLVHLMIGSIVLVIPNSLSNIPVAVLCGLFLYCAISTLRNNSIHDRVVLVLTEQVGSCIFGLFNEYNFVSNFIAFISTHIISTSCSTTYRTLFYSHTIGITCIDNIRWFLSMEKFSIIFSIHDCFNDTNQVCRN